MASFTLMLLSLCYIKQRALLNANDVPDLSISQTVRIGSFNVQKFAEKKFNDEFVSDYLLKILSNFDIVLLQEVQDKDKVYTKAFVDKLAKFSKKSFKFILSDYVGRTSYKENYVYIYRSDLFEVADSFHYDDGSEELQEDTFEREPFIVLFKSKITLVNQFAIIGVHIRPDSAEQEISELVNVHSYTVNKWKQNSVVIMGDFNAGSRYISKKKLNQLALKTDKKYYWLLENEDTTVSENSATLDRIIVTGDLLQKAIVEGSAKPFKFDDQYKLSMENALRISDHYPVQFEINRKKN